MGISLSDTEKKEFSNEVMGSLVDLLVPIYKNHFSEKDLKDATLIAKSNGIISDVNAHEGLLVSSNSMLGTFRSLDHVEIEFIVPAKIFSISEKLIGKKIEVLWETGSEKLIKKNAIIFWKGHVAVCLSKKKVLTL